MWLFAAVADDEEAKVRDAEVEQATLQRSKQGYVLFDREASYVAEHKGGVVDGAGAVRRGKLSRLNTALHKMAGPVGRLLEHAA